MNEASPGRPGRATPEGTDRYRQRFAARCAPDHFTKHAGLWISSIGIGTYLGEPDDAHDAAYREAVKAALRAGINVIDTAINYRFQRAERCIGEALRELFDAGEVQRDEIVVATKGGFIPFDGAYPTDPAGWFRKALLEPGLAAPDDVVANCHVMTPAYLEAQAGWSRRNLGLATIDLYYVHNPETQLQEVPRAEFIMRLRAAFERLEQLVAGGAIGLYGVATWDGLRAAPDHPSYLSLREIVGAAAHAGGETHHFGACQLPVNLVMPEACLEANQAVAGGRASLLEAAADHGLVVMASGSLLQGQMIRAMGDAFDRVVPDLRTNAQRGIQIVRSVPGLATALVGMKRTDHVEENAAVARLPRMPGPEVMALLRALRQPPRAVG